MPLNVQMADSRRAAFDEAAVGPFAADADALGHVDAFAIEISKLAVVRHAGAEQALSGR